LGLIGDVKNDSSGKVMYGPFLIAVPNLCLVISIAVPKLPILGWIPMFLSDGFARNASICVEGIGGADWVDGPSGLGGWRHCPTLYKRLNLGWVGPYILPLTIPWFFTPVYPK